MRHLSLMCVLPVLAVMTACDPPDLSKVAETRVKFLSDDAGRGREAHDGDLVTIAYRVTLPDGKEVLRDDAFRFILGQGAVVSGLEGTVSGMKSGGRRVVECPPQRHWGRGGYGSRIPPNTSLIFHVKLTSIE